MTTISGIPHDFKKCSKCGEIKPLSEFARCAKSRDGLKSECKTCQAERRRRYYAEHAEEERERARRYHAEHPEERRERAHQYRAEHAEEWREYQRQYRAEHPEEVREYDRQYKAEHAEEERERKHARRAREISAPGTHTAADLRLQARAQTDKRGRLICWWCGQPIEGPYQKDHRIPLGRGGSNWPENIVIVHVECNLSKGTKLPGEFNGRLL